MDSTSNKDLYDRMPNNEKVFHTIMMEDTQYDIDMISAILKKHHCKTVLDCACNNGLVAVGLAEHGFQVSAIDLSEEAIFKIWKLTKQRNISVDFHEVDIRNTSDLTGFFEQSFDAVICMNNEIARYKEADVIREVLQNIKECLTENGIAIFGTMDFDPFMEGDRLVFTPVCLDTTRGGINFHLAQVSYYDDSVNQVLVRDICITEKQESSRFHTQQASYYPLRSDLLESFLEQYFFIESQKRGDDASRYFICRRES